jgi:hypothetical protein
MTTESSGLVLERKDAIVFAVRDGKVVRLAHRNNGQQVLEAMRLAG